MLYRFVGLEEDFKVWLDDFVREVFPVLVGERALQDLTPCDGGHTPCECGGGKSEGNCCKSSKEEVRVVGCCIISIADKSFHHFL